MDTKYCSWAPSSRRCRHTPQSQHHRSPGHRWGRWSHKLPQRCQSGRGLRTWAPASQAHSADSAQCLADRPLQAGSGGTAACSSPQRCQEGRAGGTGSRSSLARRPRSCLCLQSMAYSACTGHSCRGTGARTGRRGRAARSARHGSRAGRCTGRRRRCSGRARIRTAPGTRGPTSPAGRRSGPTPARTASRGRRSGSCSGGPTSLARTGRSRWPDCTAPPRGCTGTGGGTWATTSRDRSGTRRSRGCSGRGDRRRTGTRSGRPSGRVGSGTRRWPVRTGRAGGRHRPPCSRDPSTGPGSLRQGRGERKRVSGLKPGTDALCAPPCVPGGALAQGSVYWGGAGPPSRSWGQPVPLGHSSLPAPNSEPQGSVSTGLASHFHIPEHT